MIYPLIMPMPNIEISIGKGKKEKISPAHQPQSPPGTPSIRRSSCPRTEVSPAILAFRDTVSRNSPGAVSLKLVPPGQGNLCPEPRTPKGNLFSVARTPGLFETPRFFCRPLPLPHTHTPFILKRQNTNDFYFASIFTLQRI